MCSCSRRRTWTCCRRWRRAARRSRSPCGTRNTRSSWCDRGARWSCGVWGRWALWVARTPHTAVRSGDRSPPCRRACRRAQNTCDSGSPCSRRTVCTTRATCAPTRCTCTGRRWAARNRHTLPTRRSCLSAACAFAFAAVAAADGDDDDGCVDEGDVVDDERDDT